MHISYKFISFTNDGERLSNFISSSISSVLMPVLVAYWVLFLGGSYCGGGAGALLFCGFGLG